MPEKSVIEKLRDQHNAYFQQLQAEKRQIIDGTSNLAIEMAEVQGEYIRELEAKLDTLKKENMDLVCELEIYKFKVGSRIGERLREEFPTKGELRRRKKT